MKTSTQRILYQPYCLLTTPNCVHTYLYRFLFLLSLGAQINVRRFAREGGTTNHLREEAGPPSLPGPRGHARRRQLHPVRGRQDRGHQALPPGRALHRPLPQVQMRLVQVGKAPEVFRVVALRCSVYPVGGNQDFCVT